MYDTLCRHFMPSYGNEWIKAPNFERLVLGLQYADFGTFVVDLGVFEGVESDFGILRA